MKDIGIMKQKELKQLSRHIINGEKEERLSTLTMEEKAKLLVILKEREAELLNKIQEKDLEIMALREKISFTKKKLSRIKGHTPVDNESIMLS